MSEELVIFFKALADSNRLKIVGLLAEKSYSVEELAELLKLKASTVSHHLARLVGVRVQQLDRHDAANGFAGGGGQRLHVVLVMPHPQRFRQSALRHAR